MTLVPTGQQDFSGGAFPLNEDVPPNGVEDCVNGLYADDGAIYRRGGSQYLPSVTSTGVVLLADAQLHAGQRTYLAEGATQYVLNAGASAWTQLTAAGTYPNNTRFRPVVVNGALIGPQGSDIDVYAGARSNLTPANPGAGTVTVTNGSRTVTGVGTAFTTNAEKGSIFRLATVLGQTNRLMVVDSVASATSMELVEPWPDATTAGASNYLILQSEATRFPSPFASNGTVVSGIFGRVVAGREDMVLFTDALGGFKFAADDFHRLPQGALVLGLEPLGGTMLVFSTVGVFAISNMAYDLTDDLGNAQQRMEHVDAEMVLWGDAGIAGWEGTIIAPAVDDVYLLSGVGARKSLGRPIRTLYRQYVEAGYAPGGATVFQGHYILPILTSLSSSGTWVDTLVCKLSTGAWSRWSGHGGTVQTLARRVSDSSSSRSPRLFGFGIGGGGADSPPRAIELTKTVTPSATYKNDANATSHQLQVTTRTQMASEMVSVFWKKVRIRYELDDAASDNPTFTAEYAEGRPGSSFSALSETATEGQGTKSFPIRQRAQQIRVRITSNNATSKCILRAVEFFVRQTGRQ